MLFVLEDQLENTPKLLSLQTVPTLHVSVHSMYALVHLKTSKQKKNVPWLITSSILPWMIVDVVMEIVHALVSY